MNTATTSTPAAPASSSCPFHAHGDAHGPTGTPALQPPGAWPPGPASGLTGWGLLRRMSRDLLGTLAGWQREFGDVVHLRIWPEHEVMLTDPQLVRELLVTHHESLVRWERGMQVFAQLEGQGVFIAEGEAWRAKRHALLPAFTPKAVQAFVPSIAAAAGQALARWPAQSVHWPIEQALTSLAMDVILRMLFSDQATGQAADDIGVDACSAEQAVRTAIVVANTELYWPASSPDWLPWKRAKREALGTLDRLIDGHLQARLRQPPEAWPDDLLTRLLQLHHADPAAWPLQAVRDECMTTFIAGHETVAATLTWWAWCMAAHPQAQDTARAEVAQVLQGRMPSADDLPALRGVTRTLQETLRLYPAAPLLFSRRARQPITLGPWQLPARTLFLIPVQLMHHDPRWFAEPLAFRPERFDAQAPGASDVPRGAYLPFGAGPRVCLGQHLAMTEMTVIAAMLLQRSRLALPDGMAPPLPVLNVSLRPEQPLCLRLT